MADIWEYGWAIAGDVGKHYVDPETHEQLDATNSTSVSFRDSNGIRNMGGGDEPAASHLITALNELGGQGWEAVNAANTVDLGTSLERDDRGAYVNSTTRMEVLMKRRRG